jgi:hypothetical protein
MTFAFPQSQPKPVSAKPTQTGNYWLASPHTNLVTKEITWDMPDIVLVVIGYMHRNKPINKVLGRFWNCKLEEIPENAKWSAMIIPPNFD